MGGRQCFSELCGLLARFELHDEPLSGSDCERKITLRQAKCLARLSDCFPKLLCVLNSHRTERQDATALAIMKRAILPLGKIVGRAIDPVVISYRSG